jgi:hypothetical protein
MVTFVPFLTVEDDDDLLVSFGLGVHAETSLTLLRTPKFESLLPDDERGVSVGSGASGSLERELLVSVSWGAREVTIKSTQNVYVLDIHAVEPDEILEAKSVLRKMNFDQRFTSADV